MRVLVTGHLGYVGTALIPRLLAEHYDVRGIDSGLFQSCAYGALGPRIPSVDKDIRDLELADLDDIDAVVHLAALSNDPMGNLAPAMTEAINFHATARLAELARRAGVRRLVFASTCSNYGASDDRWLTEDSGLAPVTPYARSKVEAERELLSMASPGFRPVALRFGTAFGYSPMLRFDLVLNNLVAWASATGRVRLKSDGTAWRPLIHVDDMARAFVTVLAAEDDRLNAGIFNVGANTNNVQVSDVAERAQLAVPGSQITFANSAATDVRCYRVNFDRFAKTFPDGVPQRSIQSGAQALALALRKDPVSASDIEGPNFQRLAHLKHRMANGSLDDALRPVSAVTARVG